MRYATLRFATIRLKWKMSFNSATNAIIISTDKDPSLRREALGSFAIINLRGVSTKLNSMREVLLYKRKYLPPSSSKG